MSNEIHVKSKNQIAQCKVESEGLVLEFWDGDQKVQTNYLYWESMDWGAIKRKPPTIIE